MGHTARECNKDPKWMLYDENEFLDSEQYAGGGKCPEFKKAVNTGEKIRLILINLNHCSVTQELLSNTTRELEVQVTIISEPYRNSDNNV